MARDTTTVDGVTLTRQQVEQAMAQLNAPEPTRYPSGDVLTCGDRCLLVINPHDEWLADKAHSHALMAGRQVVAEGDGVLYVAPPAARRLCTFSELVAFWRQHHPEAGK